jgi:hypothetical protein
LPKVKLYFSTLTSNKTMADNNDRKKKKQKQTGLGMFAFIRKKVIKHNEESVEVSLPVKTEAVIKETQDHLECNGCNKHFRELKGLKSHMLSCQSYKNWIVLKQGPTRKVQVMLEVVPTSVEEEKRKQMVRYEETSSILKNASQARSLLREQEDGGGKEDSIDQRKNNRGSAVRHRLSYEQKANMIEEYQKWKEKNTNCSTRDYIKERGLPFKYQYCFTAGTKGWLSKESLDSIMKNAALSKYKHLKRPIGHDQAKYPVMEQALYQEILARRRRGAKVSSNFMRIKARQLAQQHYPESNFKASDGWLARFKSRRKLKYRKRQNQKKQNIEEKRDQVRCKMMHSGYL